MQGASTVGSPSWSTGETMKTPKRDRDDEIPAILPRVEVIDGEPVIATRHVVDASPIPRSLALILIALAVLTVGYVVFQQEQRNDDVAQMVREDERSQERIEQVIEDLREQDAVSERDRVRLRTLVIGILESETPEERAALLRIFVEAESDDTTSNGKG